MTVTELSALSRVTEGPICHAGLASFPGPSFYFNRDGGKLGLEHTVCACAELRVTLRVTRGEKTVCDLPVLFKGLRVERVKHTMHLKAPGEVYWRQFLLWRLELAMGCSRHL